MALSQSIETNSGDLTPTGIIIAVAPGADPNAPLELYRAADSAGAPDAANQVLVFAGLVPPAGFMFFDQLVKTAATYWYRARMSGGPYGPSPYTDWINLGAPDRLSQTAAAAISTGDASPRSAAWEQTNARIGPQGNILPNPGFEDGEAFWVTELGTGTIVTLAASASSGNKYLKLTSTTGVAAATRACDDVGKSRYFEVNTNDLVQFGGSAYRESGTANVRYVLELTDKDKANPTLVNTPNQNTAAWAQVQAQTVVGAGKKYARFWAEVDATGTGVVARFDDAFARIALSAIYDVPPPNSLYEIRFANAVPDPDGVDGIQTYIDFPASTNFMRVGKPPKAIVSSTAANPIVVTATAHNLVTGNMVTIRGHLLNTAANGTFPVTVLDNDRFSIPADGTAGTNGVNTGHVVKLSLIIVGGTGTESGNLKVYGDVQADTFTGVGAATFLGGLRSVLGGALFRSLQHSTAGEYGDQTVKRVVMEGDALVLKGDAGPVGAGVGMDLETARLGSYSVATSALTARSSKDITGQTAGSKGWTDPDGSDNGKNTINHTGNGNTTIAAGSRLWQKLGDSATEGDSVDAYDDAYKIGFVIDAHYTAGGNPNATVTSMVQVEYSTDASFATWTTLGATYSVIAGGTGSGYPASASAVFTPTVSVPGNPTHVGFRLVLNLSSNILDSTHHTGSSDGSVYCYASAYRTNNYVTTWSTSTGASQYRRGLKLSKVKQPQQLLNRDFELGSPNWAQYAGSISILTDPTKAHTGSNYLQVTSSGAAFAGASQVDSLGATVYVPVTPGDVVTFGGWAYRESGTSSVYYVINAYDASKVFVTGVTTALVTTAAWTQVTNTYTVPASGVSYIAFFAEVNNVATTVARFDDATLIVGLGDVPHVYLEPVDTVVDDVDGLEGELQFVGGGSDGPHALAYHDGYKPRLLSRTLLAANASTSTATSDTLIASVKVKARHMNKIGRVLRIRWGGRGASGGSVVTLKLGSITWASITVTANKSWWMEYTLTTGATGASGTLDGSGLKINDATAAADDGNTGALDLTADFDVGFYVRSTSGTLTHRVATVEWLATQ